MINLIRAWIDPVFPHPIKQVLNPESVSRIDQKRDFPIYENAVAVVFTGVVPKVNIKVFGNFHRYLAFVIGQTLNSLLKDAPRLIGAGRAVTTDMTAIHFQHAAVTVASPQSSHGFVETASARGGSLAGTSLIRKKSCGSAERSRLTAVCLRSSHFSLSASVALPESSFALRARRSSRSGISPVNDTRTARLVLRSIIVKTCFPQSLKMRFPFPKVHPNST